MGIFLSDQEKVAFEGFRRKDAVGQDLFWALANRVEARAAEPGLHGIGAEPRWWYCACKFLTDAAMMQALKPTAKVGAWLRDATLSLVQRSDDDWAGPAFRSHGGPEPVGHLETSHLTLAVAAALDLAPDAFGEAERGEAAAVLRERGLPMCRRWLERNNHLANWRCVLNAGAAVAAAVLDDGPEMERAAAEFALCLQAFQPDGSYGESLQYANYAAWALTLAREALVRRRPEFAARLPFAPYALMPRWQTASLLYRKPLAGWGSRPRPRSANFNDSSAMFRPSADVLLHISARAKDSHPAEAGLARWLFDLLYAGDMDASQGGDAFGFHNSFGFLSVPLLPAAAPPLSPEEAGLPLTMAFSCGDVLARDGWGGRTVLAVHGGGDPLHGPGHLHGDLNSFLLAHNEERMLADPGHSCYRNLIHGLETASSTHNTCTFELGSGDPLGLQENLHSSNLLEQSRLARRTFDPQTREPGPPFDRGARRLLAAREGEATAVGSEAAALYGPPIMEFSRFWLLCGAHALFVVDRIVSERPVRTRWHWLLNDRDGALEFKPVPPDRVVARRGRAGMKLFHLGGGTFATPQHAFVHDAYSPTPGGRGEGRPGSGLLLTWREPEPALERTVVHAIALDGYGPVAGWHLRESEAGPALESPDKMALWRLRVGSNFEEISVSEDMSGRTWTARVVEGRWRLAGG